MHPSICKSMTIKNIVKHIISSAFSNPLVVRSDAWWKCEFRQHRICNIEQMHPPKPKVAACWWIYCCYLQKRQPSFKITMVIKHFDAELSPCQAKVQAGNSRSSRVQGKKGAAADPPKVHWWGRSCPGCHTTHLTHMHTPNKDTFCSQGLSLCNGSF